MKTMQVDLPDFSMMTTVEAAKWFRSLAEREGAHEGCLMAAGWLEELTTTRDAVYEAKTALAKAKW
jgi:hypothetical protein